MNAETKDIENPENTERKIKRIHTSCKDCAFAVYTSRTQTGCKLNRIEKFRPDSIIEAFNLDERGLEIEFFVINGRYCNAFRSQEWAEKQTAKQKDPAAAVRQEIQLKLSIIVPLEPGLTVENLLITATSLKAQSIPPHQVFFLNLQKDIPISEIHTALFQEVGNAYTWRITNSLLEQNKAIDALVGQIEGSVFSVFYPGYAIPSDFIQNLDYSLNELLERWVLLTPVAGQGLTVNKAMFKSTSVGMNVPWLIERENGERFELTGIEEKIRFYSDEHDQPWLIKTYEDLCW